jgi:hypothetical protein
MTRSELNISYLRSEAERPPGPEPGSFRLSRRQLLQAGGSLAVAATGMATVLQSAGHASAGAVEVSWDVRQIVLRVGGVERWLIDARQFGGEPRVSVTEEAGLIRMTLMGATFPGTALAADLGAELSRVGAAWRLRLSLAAGRFAAEVGLVEWLSGAAPARSRVRLNDPVTALGASGSLRLDGAGEAVFTPDWQLRVTGPNIARLATADLSVQADAATIALVPAEAPSLLQHAASRRTLITLQRQGKAWGAWPGLAALDGGRVLAGAEPFDQIRVEAHETLKGSVRQALVAETTTAAAGILAYVPGPELTFTDGTPARLDLRNARYAAAFDPAGDQTALVARFSEEPAWVCARGCTLHLGDAPNAKPFELIARGGEVTRRNVAPTVFSMAASMPGAIVEPIRSGDAGPIEIVGMHGFPVESGAEVAAVGGEIPVTPTPTLPIVVPPIVIQAPAAYVSVIRPADMLHFEVKFLNLRLTTRADGPPYLERIFPLRDAYLLFRFPPQHMAEKAFYEGTTAGTPPIPSRAAGPSWVAFTLPTAVKTLDYTLPSLLNWSAWTLRTQSSLRDPSNNDGISEPFTAIESPYRMFLSPSPNTYWRHQIEPITLDNRSELWHTQLARRPSRGGPLPIDLGPAYPSVRAVWTPDYTTPPPDSASPPQLPFRYSMDARMRYEIVAQSPLPAPIGTTQPPIRVENLMLTSQGAWMKIEGHWNPPPGKLKYSAWRHEATMGRDQFVKVVAVGYLYPFGHKALLVTETQRRIETVPLTTRSAAYLRQKEYIVVVERERTYPDPEGAGAVSRIKRNRNLPLRSVTVLTGTTPTLDDPLTNTAYQVPSLGVDAFWPRFSNGYFSFHMAGEDWEGQRIEFTAPLIWVSNIPVTQPAKMALVKLEYDKLADRRTADMRGQQIAYAPRVPVAHDTAGDTVLETASLTFTGVPADTGETMMPPFMPQMDTAAIKVGSLTQMTGSAAPRSIRMDPKWLEKGFGAGNEGMVFAAFDGMPNISFGGDKSGAVMTPDMPLAGLSLSHGLVGGNNDMFGSGKFDPAAFFQTKAKLLGGVVLAEIIETVNDVTSAADKTKVPRITSRLHYPGNDTAQPPDSLDTDMVWEPALKTAGPFLNFYHPTADADDDDEDGSSAPDKATLTINANLHAPLKSGAAPTYHVHGELNRFTVNLADCIRLGFHHLHFTSDSGKDPKTDIGLTWVRFAGALEFVETLRNALGDIFGDGFKLDVEPVGIRASFSVALPKIAMGVFSLTNMSLGAGFELPFTGKPALVNFAFCTRENPFCLTISMFGGGGFFGITLGMSGVEILEVALEFGASVSIDLGVASGGVSVKAGIYFKYVASPPDGPGSLLEGYVKIHGEMTVLLIASLSITLYLSLTYKTPNKCWGQATLTVEVEVLFISFSVEVHAERQFSGDDHDPSFSQMITAGQWSDYTLAFA